MTPETYMRRYHGDCGDGETEQAISAEELYPSCSLAGESGRSRGSDTAEDTSRESECCCKASMVDALQLLCGETLGSLVDFDAFFFLTDSLTIGSPLAIPDDGTDNIVEPAASLRRFSPCNCDLLELSGTAYFAIPCSDIIALEDVDQLSLCAIKAVAFQIEPSEADDPEDTNFRRAVRAIRRAIRAEGGNTGACRRCGHVHCDCDNCCCASGILGELSARNLSRLATLTAGPLVLQDATVLGSVGSVLVLADEELSRIYLVCANAIEVLG